MIRYFPCYDKENVHLPPTFSGACGSSTPIPTTFLLCKSPRAQAAGAARLAGFTVRTGAQCPQSGRLCVKFTTYEGLNMP